jgi:hypothetical protein
VSLAYRETNVFVGNCGTRPAGLTRRGANDQIVWLCRRLSSRNVPGRSCHRTERSGDAADRSELILYRYLGPAADTARHAPHPSDVKPALQASAANSRARSAHCPCATRRAPPEPNRSCLCADFRTGSRTRPSGRRRALRKTPPLLLAATDRPPALAVRRNRQPVSGRAVELAAGSASAAAATARSPPATASVRPQPSPGSPPPRQAIQAPRRHRNTRRRPSSSGHLDALGLRRLMVPDDGDPDGRAADK